jgi:hypothetical protein
MPRFVAFGMAMLMAAPVYATQVIPTGVEYTNDIIEQGGKLQACIVTAAILNLPAPEIVNFQFLVLDTGSTAFKVTAGEVNWNSLSSVAKRISAADFSTAQFNHPAAFNKIITPEGQLLGILIDHRLNNDFITAFFSMVVTPSDLSVPISAMSAFTTFNKHLQQMLKIVLERAFIHCVCRKCGNEQ